jgi:hypothetical protein
MLTEKDNLLIVRADAHSLVVAHFIGWFGVAISLGLAVLGVTLGELVLIVCSLFLLLVPITGFGLAHAHQKRSTTIDPRRKQVIRRGVARPLSEFEALYLLPAGQHVELGFILRDEGEDAALAVLELFKDERKFLARADIDDREGLADALDWMSDHLEAWSQRAYALGECVEKQTRTAALRLAEALGMPVVDLTGAAPRILEAPAGS